MRVTGDARARLTQRAALASVTMALVREAGEVLDVVLNVIDHVTLKLDPGVGLKRVALHALAVMDGHTTAPEKVVQR